MKLANGLGVEGARATTMKACADLMAHSFRQGGPSLIELMIVGGGRERACPPGRTAPGGDRNGRRSAARPARCRSRVLADARDKVGA